MERIAEYQDERWKERAKQIRALDGHKCAICGAKGELHVHHLAYPPAPFHIWDCRDDELVTLCPECHKKVHRSSSRVSLDKYRNIIGFIDDECNEDIDIELRNEFQQKQRAALDSDKDCCAKCIFAGVPNYPNDITYFCPLSGVAFYPVEPDKEPCEHFDKKNCYNCKHFEPDFEGAPEGMCKAVLCKGEPCRAYDIDYSLLCDGDLWELKKD